MGEPEAIYKTQQYTYRQYRLRVLLWEHRRMVVFVQKADPSLLTENKDIPALTVRSASLEFLICRGSVGFLPTFQTPFGHTDILGSLRVDYGTRQCRY